MPWPGGGGRGGALDQADGGQVQQPAHGHPHGRYQPSQVRKSNFIGDRDIRILALIHDYQDDFKSG